MIHPFPEFVGLILVHSLFRLCLKLPLERYTTYCVIFALNKFKLVYARLCDKNADQVIARLITCVCTSIFHDYKRMNAQYLIPRRMLVAFDA